MSYYFTSESVSEGHPDKVAALHLEKLGAELTELKQDQAAYIEVTVKGPFKPEYYRY